LLTESRDRFEGKEHSKHKSIGPSNFLIEMIHCTSHNRQTQSNVAASFSGRRRIIFPTVDDKYHSLPTPIISRKGLSDHIKNIQHNPTLTSSVESDMPSLASVSIVSDSTSTSIPSMTSDDSRFITDDSNHSALLARKAVRFDPRIWVHEFDRTDADKKELWFSDQDLNIFKFGAMRCIMAYNSSNPNSMTKHKTKSIGKKRTGSVLYSHPALGIDSVYDDYIPDYHHQGSGSITTTAAHSPLVGTIAGINSMVNQFREAVAENEIRHILVVDPQEICLKLYTKGLQRMFPNATIVTARNKEEALQNIQDLATRTKSGNDFDIIITDEAKNPSDSKLFVHINQSIKTPGLNITVVSQRVVASQNRHVPETDLTWTKPPPSMNDSLRDQILKAILIKRGRSDIAKKLFT
jgi:hypothetical protein